MAQRSFASEAETSVLTAPRLAARQLDVARDRPANTLSQQMLNLQRTVGNRAVQRLVLAREPDVQAEAKPAVDVADNAAVADPAAKAVAPHETVPTNWFLDSWGVAGRKGRGDSKPEDVLVLEGLTIGSGDNTKTFEHAGNALQSGRSHLGRFDHSKGQGDADGVVSYASQNDIDIDFQANTPPESAPMDRAAKAQKQAAEARIKAAAKQKVLELVRAKGEISGDWDAVEKEAAAVAAEQLPAGSSPAVKISSKVKHERFRLKTTPYSIEKPATCTVNIIVPTTTTTYQVRGGESTTVTAAAAASGSTTESETIDVGGEISSFLQTTRTSFIQTVNSLHQQIASKSPGGGDVKSDDTPDLTWTQRAKKWLKGKASGLWDKAKDTLIAKGKSFLESKLAKWVIEGLELDGIIEIELTKWVVDWLGDKAADKVKGWLVKTHRSPGPEQHCGKGHTSDDLFPPTRPDLRQDQCTQVKCHDRHPHNLPSTPQSPGPMPMHPGPMHPGPGIDPCPPKDVPPLIKSDDSDIVRIFSEVTNEIISSSSHASLEVKKGETQSGAIGAEVTHHTEYYYSGPVTKELVGHPAIEVIVEDRN